MAENPIRAAAAATGGLVSGSLLEAIVKRLGHTLNVDETLEDTEFDVGEPPLVVHSVLTGNNYTLDLNDTTSPYDDLFCLVSGNGLRYIVEEGAALHVSSVLDVVTAPTGSEIVGDTYVVAPAATGAFTGRDDNIALLGKRGWVFGEPTIGYTVLNRDTGTNIQYGDSGWGGFPVSIDAGFIDPNEMAFPMGLGVEAQQNAPAIGPTVGDHYIVGLAPTGAWSGQANKVAYYTASSTWAFLTPYDGARVFNRASDAELTWFDATGDWRPQWPIASMCQGRLTLESGNAISTTDQTAKATLYFTPFGGNAISLYVNGGWALRTFTEKSLSLAGYTTGKPFDIFGYDNAGVLALESLVWTNDTTRATATALQDGIKVKSGDPTRRLLGTIYTTATGQTEDSMSKRNVANYTNKRPRPMRRRETTDSWSYSSVDYRPANNNAANSLEFVICESEELVRANVVANSGGLGALTGIGLDVDTTGAADSLASRTYSDANLGVGVADYAGYPGVGRHRLIWLEATGGGSVTFYGDNGGGASLDERQSGILGTIHC